MRIFYPCKLYFVKFFSWQVFFRLKSRGSSMNTLRERVLRIFLQSLLQSDWGNDEVMTRWIIARHYIGTIINEEGFTL